VIEEEIDLEILIADFERHLPAYEREAAAEFEQEALDVVDESLFDLALAARIHGAEEIEEIGILEHLRGHVRIPRRQRGLEVCEGFSVAFVGAAVDLQAENRLRPPLPQRLPGVPQSRLPIIETLEQGDILAPGQLCNDPLHNSAVGPCRGKGAHVLQVSRRKPLHFRVGLTQVRGEAIDDPGSPAGAFLVIQDRPTDVPVQHDHRRVGGQDDTQPLSLDALLDLAERLRIAARQLRTGRRYGERGAIRVGTPT